MIYTKIRVAMHDLAGLDGPLAGLDDFDGILALESEWEQVGT
jgi:hypothetical protein